MAAALSPTTCGGRRVSPNELRSSAWGCEWARCGVVGKNNVSAHLHNVAKKNPNKTLTIRAT